MVRHIIVDRLARPAFFLLVVSSVFLSLSCGSPPPNKNTNINPNTGGVSNRQPAKISLLSDAVSIQPMGGTAEMLKTGARELQNGDSITTDELGEAAIELDSCKTIFIYRESHIKKDSCSKFESRNVYCTKKGTGLFKDCGGNIITESDSATVALVGTEASHTYLPDLQLAIVILFEGKAEARPVLDTRERTLGDVKNIPAQHFWFSVPNDRLNELKALNIGLEPRTAHPFKRLPELLAKLPNMHLDSVAEQAIRDKAVPEDVRPHFIPNHPDTADDDTIDGGGDSNKRGPGTGTGTGTDSVPTVAADMPYGFTKIKHHTIKELQTVNGATLEPDSVRILSGTGFSPVPPAVPRPDAISVSFAPIKAGPHDAKLYFRDKTGRRYQYQLSGTGASSGMKISSDNVKFAGKDPRIDSLTVTSTGDVDLEVSKVSLLQDPNQRFTIQSNCKAPLKKGQQCEITIEHTRVIANISSDTRDVAMLSIAHDAFPKPMLVPVSAPLLPALTVAEALPFGPVVIYNTCDKILTVKSNSDRDIRLGKAELDKVRIEGFSIAEDTCSNSTLSPAGKKECTLKVKFEPSFATQHDAKLTLPYGSSSGSTSRIVKLSGQGKEGQFTFLNSTAFGSVQIGAQEKIEKIQIRRMPQVATRIERVELVGPAKHDYKIRSQTCTTSTSDLCEVEIAFKPTAEGLRQAELILVAKSESGANRIPITGNAISSVTNNDSSSGYLLPASLRQDQSASIAAARACDREFRARIDGKAYAAWEVREKRGLCFGGKSVREGKDPEPRILQLHFESETKEPLSPWYNVTGDGSADFSVTSEECNQLKKSCTINIAFAPKATNKRRAVMAVAPNSTTPPIDVELYGRGKSSNPFKRFGRWVVGLFTDEAARSCRR